MKRIFALRQLLKLRSLQEERAQLTLRQALARDQCLGRERADMEAEFMSVRTSYTELCQQEVLSGIAWKRIEHIDQELERLAPLVDAAREQLALAVRQRQSTESIIEGQQAANRKEQERREGQEAQDAFARHKFYS